MQNACENEEFRLSQNDQVCVPRYSTLSATSASSFVGYEPLYSINGPVQRLGRVTNLTVIPRGVNEFTTVYTFENGFVFTQKYSSVTLTNSDEQFIEVDC